MRTNAGVTRRPLSPPPILFTSLDAGRTMTLHIRLLVVLLGMLLMVALAPVRPAFACLCVVGEEDSAAILAVRFDHGDDPRQRYVVLKEFTPTFGGRTFTSNGGPGTPCAGGVERGELLALTKKGQQGVCTDSSLSEALSRLSLPERVAVTAAAFLVRYDIPFALLTGVVGIGVLMRIQDRRHERRAPASEETLNPRSL